MIYGLWIPQKMCEIRLWLEFKQYPIKGLWNWEQFSTELSNHQLKYQQTVSFS
jgi:hypothetical protein